MNVQYIQDNKKSPMIKAAAKDAVKLGKFTSYKEALEKIAVRPSAWLGVIKQEMAKYQESAKAERKAKAAQKRLTKLSYEQEQLLLLVKAESRMTANWIKTRGYRSTTIKALIRRGLVEEVYSVMDRQNVLVAA